MNLNLHELLKNRLHAPARGVPPHSGVPSPAGTISDTIEQALASAGLDTRTGVMKSVAETIQGALAAAGLSRPSVAQDEHRMPPIEGTARDVSALEEERAPASAMDDGSTRPGAFLDRTFADGTATLAYKLYVPASYAESAERVAVVVMLHGCTQSPDDFAAGTQMNALADRHGFLVVYPAQSAKANGMKCWNWFRAGDQDRGAGEPALIAGAVRQVLADYRVDERRVFVAGMSAGAAMAVVLGATYPDLFAAVGAHSGLPYRAARDMPSAIGAMNGSGTEGPASHAASATDACATRGVPTIVFHGDQDHTVNPRNGAAIAARAVAPRGELPSFVTSTRRDERAGRAYSVIVHADGEDLPFVEHWIVHGAGHAWSGGSPAGSYTDAGGPNASAEMIRFFYAQQRAHVA